MSKNIYTDISEPAPTAQATPSPNPHHQNPTAYRFEFLGTGLAYFKIWIVNLVLTILTLGIYSPWAKVRRLRYFYGNTKLNNRTFDFTANPKRILVGRLIAIGIYLVVSTVWRFSPEVAIAGSALLFVIYPWLMRSSLRFMARNSQYNNVRFAFNGGLGAAYGLFIAILLLLLLNIISFGLLLPLTWWMFKRYQFNETYFGQLKFNFNTSIWDVYKACILPMIILILVALALIAIGLLSKNLNEGGFSITHWLILIAYLSMLLVIPLMQGYVHKAIWGKLTLGNNRFELVNFSPLKFAFIHLTNYFAIILTLGLLYPWAAVRIHRYKTETLSLIAYDNFDAIATPSVDNVSPLGEEISDVFDFDVSW
ncbi:DUF898 domain-containing protein [Moraxella nasovis]|uniref:YjgN family protein n=1 Tax=Moraxella nasovis TaxID=2904121 RepID=UPI001F61C0C0|nr:YjgN family protein [Moraxella nasovis]UNU72611.1 DUF898 domain-containing protein [Moraxella nasovis]